MKDKVNEEFRIGSGTRAIADIVHKFNENTKSGKKIDHRGSAVIDKMISDGYDPQTLVDSMIKYDDILTGSGRGITARDYIKAIEFTSYIVGGMTYAEAWKKVFPNKAEGKAKSYVSSSASQYANGGLVGNMLGRVYLNQHIMFIDKTIQAKLELYKVGMGDGFEKDKINALDKFLTHTTKYEEKAGLVVNNFSSGSQTVNIVNAIDNKLKRLAEVAQKQIEDGIVDAQIVAEDGIKMGEDDA